MDLTRVVQVVLVAAAGAVLGGCEVSAHEVGRWLGWATMAVMVGSGLAMSRRPATRRKNALDPFHRMLLRALRARNLAVEDSSMTGRDALISLNARGGVDGISVYVDVPAAMDQPTVEIHASWAPVPSPSGSGHTGESGTTSQEHSPPVHDAHTQALLSRLQGRVQQLDAGPSRVFVRWSPFADSWNVPPTLEADIGERLDAVVELARSLRLHSTRRQP